MADKYVHIFGIPVEELKFKENVLRHIESCCWSENLPYADDDEKGYYEFDDFFLDNVPELDCVWFSYGDKLADPNFDGGTPHIIGIKPTYSWNRDSEPQLSSETRAREFIAKSLLPFVTQPKEELRDLCDYIEAPLPEG